ncbi:EamA family transporter RarD [Propioniferax innocua]|uniref:Chloramphenicol-sensitive protein RarD n=1 Tax=Propioniferax innocua TaxID=1753 RepID=A0A542ZST4_9ACTN|nr:EamA family transporter RarD [Propioniferax innocua]TQL63415.1 chloramphenicol-sensitive protein RarD [Propioniferax innocua]
MTTPDSPGTHDATELRSGALYAIGAYGLWALLPLLFVFIEAGPIEILAIRVVFSVFFCLLLMQLVGRWSHLREAVASRETVGWLSLASLLMGTNWLCFIFATTTGRVLEASLAYFINPLMTVLLSVLVLRERLRILQWVAIGIGVAAVVVMTVAYGTLPLLSLLMATSFAIYGLVKRRLGRSTARPLGAIPGLTLETLFLLAPALIAVVLLWARGDLVTGSTGWLLPTLLAGTGVLTAVPLIFFAAAASRIPLSWVGMFQYIAPIGQFIIGWGVLGEPMPASRWLGFAIVWVAVLVFIGDVALRRRERQRQLDVEPRLPGTTQN